MIPLILEAKNFMAYEHLELDFSPFQIACLTGANGSGKSSILDALTWALFEKSRSPNSEDIIRLGESEVSVQFSFELENKTYRILRSRQRSKGKSPGKHTLEFQVKSEEGFRSLSGKGVKETQQEIIQTLRMDYTLFINSSFILQGRADVFTTSSAKERKDVLADILNLNQYEKLQALAKEKKTRFQQEKQVIQGQLQQLEAQLTAKPFVEEQILSLQEAEKELNQKLKASQNALETKTEAFNRLQLQNAELQIFEQRQVQLKQELSLIEKNKQENQIEQARILKLREQRPQIEAGYQRLQSYAEQKTALEAQVTQLQELQTEKHQAQQKFQSEAHAVSLKLNQAQEALKYLRKEAQKWQTLQNKAPEIRADWERYTLLLTEFQTWEEKFSQDQFLRQSLLDKTKEVESFSRELEDQAHALRAYIAAQSQKLEAEVSLQDRLQDRLSEMEALNLLQHQLNEITTAGQAQNQFKEQKTERLRSLAENELLLAEKKEQLESHQADACPLCERLLNPEDLNLLVQKYSQDLNQNQTQQKKLQQELEDLEAQILSFRAEYSQLTRELKKRDPLQKEIGQIEQALEALKASKAELIEKEAELAQLLDALKHSPSLQRLRAEKEEISAQIRVLDYQPERHQKARKALSQYAGIEQKFKEAEQAETELAQLTAQIAEQAQTSSLLETILQEQSFAPELKAQITRLEHELEPLPEWVKNLQFIRDEIQRLKIYQQKWEALLSGEELWGQISKESERIAQTEASLVLEQTQLFEKLSQAEQIRQAYLSAESETRLLKTQLNIYLAEEKENHAKIFALEKELQSLNLQSEMREEALLAQKNLDQEFRLYAELTDIFGQKGIQAVVIENAIPEIEHAANDLLSQMTEGRMHIKFQTLKSLKSKDSLVETLDILISDEMGTRSYETFSAGETFRVNFAIRLAISRMLARRAGAKLQTLVIDEGFGSQDEQGKSRLVEAINSVAGLYACILVITHVDDLKSLFPFRIEVQKYPEGSRVRLSH
ncbi:hypothetical protein COW36_11090 [bacterium (Candidatus Blackallbacteria) CG17_big_fil_post_rev_8_21_14_2_50_48_46]|uniref:Zinc-hook domain-containing protein n=1 Tax=bacterium (Candidatus Blackallbacteria) CG17_big_fil_post_rev_8_21_14_2_50_48_46 TaxID=2014261 RepID=A0A2M7G4K9_9BACT|nr:MAG: hypothetical protein COW64_18185 [bacterium (Candidatus Blackallbacteria) CG18_big_fil_WC_8_21_14_2_50_49_26]PIW16820.1 MAG: hypothetical protein COW36_11090 [bacterium (Candidatus Blackallbacteria) CG17_big_fil_post_rev_8_21_14_2_50_48_46]PIW48017.1 MAG: hypothetical protein COW20_10805 [bacterium (Candidatus Blackallbacteria) CG13_big_fil_rev_8_21_14_2_50_49_14]